MSTEIYNDPRFDAYAKALGLKFINEKFVDNLFRIVQTYDPSASPADKPGSITTWVGANAGSPVVRGAFTNALNETHAWVTGFMDTWLEQNSKIAVHPVSTLATFQGMWT